MQKAVTIFIILVYSTAHKYQTKSIYSCVSNFVICFQNCYPFIIIHSQRLWKSDQVKQKNAKLYIASICTLLPLLVVKNHHQKLKKIQVQKAISKSWKNEKVYHSPLFVPEAHEKWRQSEYIRKVKNILHYYSNRKFQ